MTQEEKITARIKSLDPGMTTLRIFKDAEGVVFWVVEDTKKVEGGKIDENRKVENEMSVLR